MVNIIDYSELKKASEVLERQQVTPHPHPNKSSGESQPISGGRAVLPFPEGASRAVQECSIHDQPGHRRRPLGRVLPPTAKHSVSSSGDRNEPPTAQGSSEDGGEHVSWFPGRRPGHRPRGEVMSVSRRTCLWWGRRGTLGSLLSSLEPREGHAHLFALCLRPLPVSQVEGCGQSNKSIGSTVPIASLTSCLCAIF